MLSKIVRPILIIVLIIFQHNLIAQVNGPHTQGRIVSRRAIYVVTYRPDSTNTAKRVENMVLDMSPSSSCFYNAISARNDSLINTVTMSSTHQYLQSVLDVFSNTPKQSMSYTIFKDYLKNTSNYIQEIRSKYFESLNKTSDFKWKLYIVDTATIAGYHCQKATTTYAGRFYTAWYTKQLPIADGPYKFGGLPGLIIQITDAKQDYDFRLASFTNLSATSQALQPSYPSFTIPATVQEMYAGQTKELYQIANNQTGYSISASPDQQRATLNRAKSFNNHIERK